MRGLLMSAVLSTAVSAGILELPTELTAADRGSAARDHASAVRQQSEDEISAQTSVTVGNAVSTQTATTSTSGGKASISLSTMVRTSQGGETITQVQRATANATVD
jgi:hypothetical protein